MEIIEKILDAHSVPHYENAGRIYADSMVVGSALFEDVEDMTSWTSAQLLGWLGY